MDKQPLDLVKENVIFLLEHNKVKEALELMSKKIGPISDDLSTSISLNWGTYTSLNNEDSTDTIANEKFEVGISQLRRNLMKIMKTVDTELEVRRMMDDLNSVYVTNYKTSLEKIQGPNNNLQPINWLLKAILVSRGVCQVVLANGNKGTGWVLEGGWLMTNHHVIPTRERAKTAKVVFDYEEDVYGVDRTTSDYLLDYETAIFSSLLELDYAYIKIKDDPNSPLSNWGHLKINTLQDPQIDQFVNIIQHPLGQKKQIALTENKIVKVDKEKLFYMTDTETGSSGAPVFNSDWEVIALHHAGKTEKDGGLTVNRTTGERMGANEGILIKYIMADIKSKLKN